ncbi:MMPL family transporter [Streptomyces sp. AJS327]|uniref:MMPL family transporter n=1 Tax=Streptomyces sp. AJS327 TaxID=2545265 RepID=UPI0015DD71DB|nr:MMPL family transporter [Streptomyces sp. AJS327]MBA0051738.1 MMPL family transporter [Streptomyces sp. AJS327]
MTALAHWCLRRRVLVVLLWLAVLAGTATASALAGSAYSADYDVPGTESGQAARQLTDAFPERGGSTATVVFHAEGDGGVRSAEARERVSGALDAVAELPGVEGVENPYGAGEARLLSADGHTGQATVAFGAPLDALDSAEVDRVVDTARAAAGDGLRVEVGGEAVGQTGTPTAQLPELIGLGAAAVVLFLAFGSLAATALPLVTAVVGVGTAAAGVGLLSRVMTVADFAPVLGVLIGLGVGIDYALFIVTRHRAGLRAGLPVAEAAARAVTVSGRAVVFAGATVCVALLGMLVLQLGFLTGVALAASLTVLLTVAASVTLLPALLGVTGMRALSVRERNRLAADGPRPQAPGPLAARWSRLVERRPRVLGLVAAALMAVLALPVFGLHLGTSDQGTHPASSTTRQAYDLLADGFGPGANGPLSLVAEVDGPGDRAAVERLPGTLRQTPGVERVSTPEFDTAGTTGVITVVPESAPQSRETSDLVDELRERTLPEATGAGGPKVRVGGVTAGYDDFAEVVVGKLPLFVGTVVGLGCLLLLLAFRSVGIPLKAAVMNILAVAASFGVVIAVFQWGWGSEPLGLGSAGPIEPFLPVIMVSVLFGLSMDYQVFLVSRMYEEWKLTGDNRRAVRVGLAETGRVINSAAVIMIAVFGAFVLSGDRIIAMFGVGLAAAVALDAFVLRTLLVPALMHLLGGANWWLPRWLDRWLPRLSVEPEGAEAPTAPPSARAGTPMTPPEGFGAPIPRPTPSLSSDSQKGPLR